ncbi:MAG: GAF domain-containing protein, partial [Lapillicoccus sp.]
MELRRLTGLGRVTRDLSAARDLSTVTDVVTRHVAEVVESELAMLVMREGDEMVVLGRRGTADLEALAADRFSMTERAPVCDAARTGEPVVLVGRDAVRRAYPKIEARLPAGGEVSLLAFPLRGGFPEAVGALGLRFAGDVLRPEPTEIELLSILSDVCAQTLLRLRAEARGADRESKLAFLSAASEELAGSLDQRSTLSTVARLAVEGFADWCGVTILEEDRLTTLAVEHRDPAQRALAQELMANLRADGAAPTVARRVLRTGRGEVHSPLAKETISHSNPDPRFLELTRRLELLS